MSDRVKRKGQKEHLLAAATIPWYRLIAELDQEYLVEYCGIFKVLPKELYERVP